MFESVRNEKSLHKDAFLLMKKVIYLLYHRQRARTRLALLAIAANCFNTVGYRSVRVLYTSKYKPWKDFLHTRQIGCLLYRQKFGRRDKLPEVRVSLLLGDNPLS